MITPENSKVNISTVLQGVLNHSQKRELDFMQKENLRVKLYNELKYRETYEEIYDHILSAVEHRNLPGDFETNANAVMKEDFGGFEAIWQTEKVTYEAVRKATWKKYKYYILNQLTGWELLCTVPLGFGFYFLASHLPQAQNALELLVTACFLLPRIIDWFRNFRNGYLLKDTKSSIRDAAFISITYQPLSVYWWQHCFFRYFFNEGIDYTYQSASGLTFLFIMSWVLLFAFAKLYRDEMKMKVAL